MASMNSRFKMSSISSISDIFDSAMSASHFTLRLALSAYAQLVLTCCLRKGRVFQTGVAFCFEISLVKLKGVLDFKDNAQFRALPTVEVVNELGS